MDAWMHRCIDARMHADAWMHGYIMAAWMRGCVDAWMLECVDA